MAQAPSDFYNITSSGTRVYRLMWEFLRTRELCLKTRGESSLDLHILVVLSSLCEELITQVSAAFRREDGGGGIHHVHVLP